MTYVKQLEDYEEAVMRKRVEEMTEDELNELISQSSQAKGPKQVGLGSVQRKRSEKKIYFYLASIK
eukprot:1140294-Pelagomonas_calceolata.AAC.3